MGVDRLYRVPGDAFLGPAFRDRSSRPRRSGTPSRFVAAFLDTLRYAAGVWRRASRLRASPTVRSSPLSRLRYAPRLRSSPPENILCPNDRKSFGHKKTSPSPSVRVTRGPRRYRSCGPRSRQARRFLLLRFHADKKTSGDDLLSHHAAVPSALKGLTSVFGMGTGGTPSL